MKYKVHIEEILSKDLTVEAETREAARAIAERLIEEEKVVLSADDYAERIIEVIKEGEF